MALSEDDKQAHLDEAMRFIIENFHGEFQRRYSICIATCGTHPEQVNNEIRNMLTHIARAVTATSKTAYGKEFNAAKGHLERATRDCLKLTNLHLLLELKEDCFYIQLRDGVISVSLRSRLIKIEDELVTARIIEVEGIHDDLLGRLEGINADLQELRAEYAHVLASPGWHLSPFRATTLSCRLWIARNFSGFWLGVAAAATGAYVYEHFTPLVDSAIALLQHLKK